jgi:hypothetical protein
MKQYYNEIIIEGMIDDIRYIKANTYTFDKE